MRLQRRRPAWPAARPWLPWLLALALLQAQALGQWHRIAHGAPVAHAVAAADHDEGLFGHADGDEAQCRLYDALGSADGLATPCASQLPVPPASPVAGTTRPQAWAERAPRPYEARAPPRA